MLNASAKCLCKQESSLKDSQFPHRGMTVRRVGPLVVEATASPRVSTAFFGSRVPRLKLH